MKNVHNQNQAELAHYIKLFYTQELGTCVVDAGIVVEVEDTDILVEDTGIICIQIGACV